MVQSGLPGLHLPAGSGQVINIDPDAKMIVESANERTFSRSPSTWNVWQRDSSFDSNAVA
jgi:hypothetical protein